MGDTTTHVLPVPRHSYATPLELTSRITESSVLKENRQYLPGFDDRGESSRVLHISRDLSVLLSVVLHSLWVSTAELRSMPLFSAKSQNPAKPMLEYGYVVRFRYESAVRPYIVSRFSPSICARLAALSQEQSPFREADSGFVIKNDGAHKQCEYKL